MKATPVNHIILKSYRRLRQMRVVMRVSEFCCIPGGLWSWYEGVHVAVGVVVQGDLSAIVADPFDGRDALSVTSGKSKTIIISSEAPAPLSEQAFSHMLIRRDADMDHTSPSCAKQ